MRVPHFIILAVELVIAALAFAGGVALLVRNDGSAVGFDTAWIGGRMFASFAVPAVMLLGLGVVELAAAIVFVRGGKWALPASALAGGTLAYWIFAQVIVMGPRSPLQPVFFCAGVVVYALAIRLLVTGDEEKRGATAPRGALREAATPV